MHLDFLYHIIPVEDWISWRLRCLSIALPSDSDVTGKWANLGFLVGDSDFCGENENLRVIRDSRTTCHDWPGRSNVIYEWTNHFDRMRVLFFLIFLIRGHCLFFFFFSRQLRDEILCRSCTHLEPPKSLAWDPGVIAVREWRV